MRPPSWLLRTIANRLESRQLAAHARAGDVQEALLGKLLARYRNTEIGKTLGLHEVRDSASFRERVPVRSGQDYLPYWNQLLTDNRPGLLHPKALRYAAVSSGTSGIQKYHPCPAEQLDAYRRFTNHAFFHALHMLGDYSLLAGNMLVTAGPPITETRPNGVIVGFASGIASLKSSRLGRSLIRPTRDIMNIVDGGEKVRRTIEQAYALDVRVLTGVPLFVIPLLEALLSAARARGHAARCARDVWPNLSLYTYSGTSLALHESRLRELLGPDVHTYEVYSSTECPVAYQYRRSDSALLVDLSAGYFEFMPVGSTRRVPIHQTEVGGLYDIVVTSHAGAFAYKLGDRVEVVGTAPYLVRFAGRDREELSVGGEKVSLAQAREALASACADTGAKVEQFFLCPSAPAAGQMVGHEWHVEFSTPPASDRAFLDALDGTLRRGSVNYAIARSTALPFPKLRTLPTGTVARYVDARTTFGQGKFLNLYNDRAVAERIDALVGEPSAAHDPRLESLRS